MSSYLIIFIIITLLIASLLKRINCYELFIEGTKEGLKTTINMFPFLFTFMFAITCLQSSGILEFIEYLLKSNNVIVFIQAIIRPISSSSSLAILIDNYNNYGVDSNISILSTLIHYISDSTLYIVPFYLGLFNIKKYNKIIALGLIVNLCSFILVYLMYLLMFK